MKRTTTKVSPWMFWRWMEIDGRKPGVKYLTRLYVVNTPWFGIKFHIFHAPDPDEHCHDHPWWFFSLLLRGGYQEVRQHRDINMLRTWPRHRGAGSVAFRSAEAIHRITSVRPGTMTLILNGPVQREWGFWVPRDECRWRWVPWREYLKVPKQTEEL